MTGILGMIKLTLDTELTGKQRDYPEMTLSSAESMLTIINEILDSARIGAGKLEIDSFQFNVKTVVSSTARFFSRSRRPGSRAPFDHRNAGKCNDGRP